MTVDMRVLVERLSRGRVLVVGDLIVDRHVRGRVERVSPEAPVQVLAIGAGPEHEGDPPGRPPRDIGADLTPGRPRRDMGADLTPGGAANVACKVAELGGQPVLAGLVGPDDDGRELLDAAKALGVDVSACVEDPSRPTTLKTRYVARGQQLLRVDRESLEPASGEAAAGLADAVARELPRCDAVVIEDYGKGALAPGVLAAALARSGAIPVVVDPCGADWQRYRGASVITPNAQEVEVAARRSAPDADALVRLARDLIDEAAAAGIAVTRGAEGILVVTRETTESVPAAPVEVFDVTGAGDAVAAAFCLGLTGGLTLVEAARVANAAGRLVVQQHGVGHVSRDQLVHPKVASRDRAAATAERVRSAGGKVAFTNGCFDLIHHGHVRLLEEARARADFLVVGVNSDVSIRRLKGPARPILIEQDRLQILGALGCVDLVVVFGDEAADEDKPLRLLEAIRPDVLVKGGEYDESQIVGARLVRSRGGDVVRVPLVEGASTSAIVARIKEADGADRPWRRDWRDE